MNKKNKLAFAMLGISSVFILFSAFFYFAKKSAFTEYDGKTKANIIKYMGDINHKVPVLSYIVDGKDYTLVDINLTIKSMQNRTITLLYKLNNPSDAKIYDNFQVWGIPLAIFIIGILSFIFGLIIYKSRI